MKVIKNLKKGNRFYQQKMAETLLENKEPFIEVLRQEWEAMERGARREKLVREAKDIALVSAKIILQLVAIGGVCTAVLVTPKIFTLVAAAQKYKKYLPKEGAQTRLNYLKQKEYINFEKIDDTTYRIKITDKGLAQVLESAFRLDKMYENIKWDLKWRVIFFDIPEKHKSARDSFRLKLKEIGFYKAQDSVFVAPYPCEREILFLIGIYNLSSYVCFMEASRMIGDEILKKYFKLI